LPSFRSYLELSREEFSNAVFRIIKRTPWPRASYEAGVTPLFYKFQVKLRVPTRHVPDFFENFGWKHGIVNGAQ
jgi:hypothetical protein